MSAVFVYYFSTFCCNVFCFYVSNIFWFKAQRRLLMSVEGWAVLTSNSSLSPGLFCCHPWDILSPLFCVLYPVTDYKKKTRQQWWNHCYTLKSRFVGIVLFTRAYGLLLIILLTITPRRKYANWVKNSKARRQGNLKAKTIGFLEKKKREMERYLRTDTVLA